MHIKGKVVLVTESGQGIGQVIALRLAHEVESGNIKLLPHGANKRTHEGF